MKLFLTGRNLNFLQAVFRHAGGFELVNFPDDADLIISHGGDGAMLGAEREYPFRLKFPLRDSQTAPLCRHHSLEKQIELLRAGKLRTTLLPKLSGSAGGRTLSGINDVFIHNSNFVSAMRYKVHINGELYGSEIVGDGVGVSTVHGSTAYYRSITHSIFRTGIGLAFSNSTELVNHLVLPEDSEIRVQILRGPCEMVADNSPERIELNAGDEGVIHLGPGKTPVLGLDIFMCPECRALRHALRSVSQDS